MSILRPHAWFERIIYRGYLVKDDVLAWDQALALHHHPDAGLEHSQLWAIWQMGHNTSYRDELKTRIVDCVLAMADYTKNVSTTFHVTQSPLFGSRGHALLFDTLYLLNIKPQRAIPTTHVLASSIAYWADIQPEQFPRLPLATLGSCFYATPPEERQKLLEYLDLYTNLRMLKTIGTSPMLGTCTLTYTVYDTLSALNQLDQDEPDLFEFIDVCDVDTLSQIPDGFNTVSSYPEWYKMVILHVLLVSPFSIHQENTQSSIHDWFIHDAEWIMNTALPAFQQNNAQHLKQNFPLLVQKIMNTKSSVSNIETFLKTLIPSSDMIAMCASIATDEQDVLPLVLLHQQSCKHSNCDGFNNFQDPTLLMNP